MLLYSNLLQFSWVQFSLSVMSDSLRPHELQHTRPPCPSPTPGVHSERIARATYSLVGKTYKTQANIYLLEITNWLKERALSEQSENETESFHYCKQHMHACVLSCLSYVWLCDTMDSSPPSFSVHGILQAKILEWVAMPSSGVSSRPRIEPASLMSPALAGWFFTTSATWEAP